MPQRIPSHRPPRIATSRRRDDTVRPNAAARGYCDKAHRAWRQAVLTRDAWQCRACGRVCSNRREAHADHIVPVSAGGERYSVDNGQTLCASCHGRKTRGEQAAASDTAGRAGQTTGCRAEKNPGCLSNGFMRGTPLSRVAPRSFNP